MLIQSILTADGRLVVLEVAGRIGGGPGANRVVELVTGFDYVGASIDQQLGRPVRFETRPDGRVFSANNAYASAGAFDRLEGMEALLSDGLVEEHYVYRMQGEEISDHLSGRSRVTAFVAADTDRAALKARLEAIYARLDVLDTEGRSIPAPGHRAASHALSGGPPGGFACEDQTTRPDQAVARERGIPPSLPQTMSRAIDGAVVRRSEISGRQFIPAQSVPPQTGRACISQIAGPSHRRCAACIDPPLAGRTARRCAAGFALYSALGGGSGGLALPVFALRCGLRRWSWGWGNLL